MKEMGFYSERYLREKRKRERRRKILRAATAVILAALIIIPFLAIKIRDYRNRTSETAQSTVPGNTVGTVPVKVQDATDTIVHRLSSGNEVIIRYSMEEGRIHYDSADIPEGECWVDFSPDATKVLINDAKSQTISVYDKDRQLKDYSLEEFEYAGQGKMLRTYYSKQTGFVWAQDARFLNDSTIVFKSQVSLAVKPFFIWAVNLSDRKMTLIDETRSVDSLFILERNKDGIIIESDGLKMMITADLKVQGVLD